VDTTSPSLRGPDARSINGRIWFVTGALLLALFALTIVVTFISATNDNARIERLKDHGVAVAVTVTGCVGNVGGSGSNGAGYTCRGSYRLYGIRYREIIGSKTSSSSAGTKVRAVADPARPSTIELASYVQASSSSDSVYFVPSLLALFLVILTFVFLRRWRASQARATRASSP